MERGYEALSLMEKHLAQHRYFVGDRTTVADIALYAHTHVAQEADFELAEFPHVVDWLARIAAEPDHLKMNERPKEAMAV
jgi:glutathione S-transferase